jgi:hypothetical protein
MQTQTERTESFAEMLGIAPPEHDVRGRILVLALYAFGTLSAAVVITGAESPGERLPFAIGAALLFGGAAFLAEAVRRFACWSWFFVAGWLVLLLLPMLDTLVFGRLGPAEAVSSAAAVMMLAGALHYLWVRRWEFWADARLDARLPPPRRVSSGWRAERLSGLRSAGHRPAGAFAADRARSPRA